VRSVGFDLEQEQAIGNLWKSARDAVLEGDPLQQEGGESKIPRARDDDKRQSLQQFEVAQLVDGPGRAGGNSAREKNIRAAETMYPSASTMTPNRMSGNTPSRLDGPAIAESVSCQMRSDRSWRVRRRRCSRWTGLHEFFAQSC